MLHLRLLEGKIWAGWIPSISFDLSASFQSGDTGEVSSKQAENSPCFELHSICIDFASEKSDLFIFQSVPFEIL